MTPRILRAGTSPVAAGGARHTQGRTHGAELGADPGQRKATRHHLQSGGPGCSGAPRAPSSPEAWPSSGRVLSPPLPRLVTPRVSGLEAAHRDDQGPFLHTQCHSRAWGRPQTCLLSPGLRQKARAFTAAQRPLGLRTQVSTPAVCPEAGPTLVRGHLSEPEKFLRGSRMWTAGFEEGIKGPNPCLRLLCLCLSKVTAHTQGLLRPLLHPCIPTVTAAHPLTGPVTEEWGLPSPQPPSSLPPWVD